MPFTYLTEHFLILVHQNPSIDNLYIAQERRSADLDVKYSVVVYIWKDALGLISFIQHSCIMGLTFGQDFEKKNFIDFLSRLSHKLLYTFFLAYEMWSPS